MSPAARGWDATPPEAWRETAAILRDPTRAEQLDGASFAGLVERFRVQALSALLVQRMREAGVLAGLDEARSALCAREEARAKASHLALLSGVERVLACWQGRVARPFALKGLHLAAAYYPAPHLRPMADADLLFEDLAEGERAWDLARQLGMAPQGVPPSRDRWLGAHELPMLQDPVSRFTLEVQGSLVFSTRDRRWLKLRGLLRNPVEVAVGGQRVLGLRPESNLLYLFAHNFVQHAASGPKLQPLVDASLVLKREERVLDWELILQMASEGGLAWSTALGLRWTAELFGSKVREDVLEQLGKQHRSHPVSLSPRTSSQDRLSLEELIFQATWVDRIRLLVSRACPTAEYMRQRYPGRRAWPLPLLYPARWIGQIARAGGALLPRQRPT